MNKFTFTYLIRNDKKTWIDFYNSLNLLYKNILSKLQCHFKVLIFYEGNPSNEVNELIDYLIKKNIKIILKKISLKNYVKRSSSENYLKNFPHVSDITQVFSLGYRDMCKFFAIDLFNDEELKDSDYYVRLDTDSFFLDVNQEFIFMLENIREDYGYIHNTIQKEDKAVSIGFGNCLYNFCKKNESLKYNPKEYKVICNEASINPKIYYTNFEIIKLKWLKKELYIKLLEHIIKSGGIYQFRWGDALIRYYSIKLIGANLLVLKGCLYKHVKVFDSRNLYQRILSFIYSKIKYKLNNDNFEKNLSSIDRFFLGLKRNIY